MTISLKSIVAHAGLVAVIAATAACSPRRIPPMTVSDLMEDRVMLDGVLMKCNQDKAKARTDTDCLNARIAIERLASQRDDSADVAKRNEAFERTREQLRLAQEKQRQEQQAKTKVDVYHLPLVPVEQPPPTTAEPAPATTPTQSAAPLPPNDASPKIVSQSNP
jgi:hypothetical protein